MSVAVTWRLYAGVLVRRVDEEPIPPRRENEQSMHAWWGDLGVRCLFPK